MILLQAATGSNSPMGSLWMFGLILLVMYFFMIRPQMKKQKQETQFRKTIDKGSKVVTNGGIHGKIIEIKESTLILETEGGNRLKVERSAISKELSAQYANPDSGGDDAKKGKS